MSYYEEYEIKIYIEFENINICAISARKNLNTSNNFFYPKRL